MIYSPLSLLFCFLTCSFSAFLSIAYDLKHSYLHYLSILSIAYDVNHLYLPDLSILSIAYDDIHFHYHYLICNVHCL
jgi:hypothetical protein